MQQFSPQNRQFSCVQARPPKTSGTRLAGAGGSARRGPLPGRGRAKNANSRVGARKKGNKTAPRIRLAFKKVQKTTLFREIDYKKGSCPEIAHVVRAKTSAPRNAALSREKPLEKPLSATAVLPYQHRLSPPVGPRGDPQGKPYIYNREIFLC